MEVAESGTSKAATLAPTCSNCGANDFVWANELKTGGGLSGSGTLSLRARGEIPIGTRVCRSCGHADLFLRDLSVLKQPHTWRPGEFVPIQAKATSKPAAPPPTATHHHHAPSSGSPSASTAAMAAPSPAAPSPPPLHPSPTMGETARAPPPPAPVAPPDPEPEPTPEPDPMPLDPPPIRPSPIDGGSTSDVERAALAAELPQLGNETASEPDPPATAAKPKAPRRRSSKKATTP